jgi:enhancing lycopene biosynthesis protein 2
LEEAIQPKDTRAEPTSKLRYIGVRFTLQICEKMKFAILLHGCGVYDGTEIQEAVLTFLAIAQRGHTYACFAPDIPQKQVNDHTTGEVMPETRNVLLESARIARGAIEDLANLNPAAFDALVLPGGFGTAKNFTTWAFEGAAGSIHPQVQSTIMGFVEAGKPIGALCMSPTTVAKALEDTPYHPQLSAGSPHHPSPYNIAAIHAGMEQIGSDTIAKSIDEIAVDARLKIVSAPCYMMETDIVGVAKNIDLCIEKVISLAN